MADPEALQKVMMAMQPAAPTAVLPLGGPMAGDAFSAAAARVRQGVMPLGGRQEGGATNVLSNYLPRVAERLASLPERAIQNSQFAVDTGTYDPAAPVEAAATMMGAGTPFAEAGAVGAAGGRLPAVRHPLTGRLQVNPQQLLKDEFVAGNGAVEIAPYVPMRVNGKFANTRDY